MTPTIIILIWAGMIIWMVYLGRDWCASRWIRWHQRNPDDSEPPPRRPSRETGAGIPLVLFTGAAAIANVNGDTGHTWEALIDAGIVATWGTIAWLIPRVRSILKARLHIAQDAPRR